MPAPRSSFPVWVVAIALVAATLAAYQPAWQGGLLWDDDAHVTRPDLRSVQGLARIWTEVGATQQYYPLLHTAFWVQHRLWGDTTLGYHLVNILLHAGAAWFLFLILRRLGIPGAPLAAAIFALHPVQVESVAWITELKNTLSGVFGLAAALAYIRYDSERKTRLYAAAIGLFAFALLSKSVTATLPGVLLVVAWWQRGRLDWRRDVLPLVPFFVIGAAAGLVTAGIERTHIGAEGSDFQFTAIERILIAGRVVWFYLGTLAWPSDLMFVYPRWQVSQADAWQYVYPAAAIALLTAAWYVRGRSRAPLAALVAFGGLLFPVLGFFNVYPFRFSFVADHFQYLACIPIVVLASAGAATLANAWVPGRRWVRAGAAAVLVVGLGSLTFAQSRQYTDAVTLYRATLTRNPSSWLAHGNLGALLRDASPDEALAHLSEAIRLRPDNFVAQYDLGNVLLQLDRADEAVGRYREAIRQAPGFVLAHYNLGNALVRTGRLEDARLELLETVRLEPDMALAHSTLGRLLQALGRLDEARRSCETAVRLQPDLAVARYDLATVLYRQGDVERAVAQFGEAVRLQPGVSEAHYGLGIALLRLGRTAEAESQVGQGMRLEPNEASALVSQGAAFEGLGHFEDARAAYARALELMPGLPPARQGLARIDAAEQRAAAAEKK